MTDSTLRPVLAMAAAFALLGPAAASAQGAGAAPAQPAVRAPALDPAFRLAGLLGFESGNDATGFALRVDGEKDLMVVGDQMKLAGVLSFGYTHWSFDETDFGLDLDATTNLYKLVPAARLILPMTPNVEVYGDLGLGLYHARTSMDEQTIPGFATIGGDDSMTGLGMRIGVGARLRFTEMLSGIVDLNWNPYFGDFDTNTAGILAGVAFRF